MKRTLCLLLALGLHLMAFAKEDANTVKIGVILPLSGDSATYGEPLLRAVKLFETECKTGTYKHNYKVLVEDNQMQGRETALILQRLINVEHIDAILDFSATSGNVVFPQARLKQVPHICLASDPKTADGKFNFLHWPTPESEARLSVDLIKRLGCHRVALMTVRHAGALAVVDELVAKLKEEGMKVAANEVFNPGERDFRFQLAKIRELKPDVFIPLAFSPEIDILLRQRKQVGLDTKVTAIECFDFLNDASDAEGCYYISAGLGTTDFQKQLLAATGKPTGYAVAYQYDMLNIIRIAYESMDAPNHAAAAEWIANMKNFPAAVGNVSMGSDGRINSTPGLFRIVHGKQTTARWEEVK